MSTGTQHPDDTPCPEWCAVGHGQFPHTAQFGTVVLTDKEFAWTGATAVIALTNDVDGAPTVELGDTRGALRSRFTLDKAERIHESLGRAINAARAAESRSEAAELPSCKINVQSRCDRTPPAARSGFAGRAFRAELRRSEEPPRTVPPKTSSETPRRLERQQSPHPQEPETAAQTAAQPAAREALETAVMAVVAEEHRPASREHWVRMAGLYGDRAVAWRRSADVGSPSAPVGPAHGSWRKPMKDAPGGCGAGWGS
jgi:hypothetical protein